MGRGVAVGIPPKQTNVQLFRPKCNCSSRNSLHAWNRVLPGFGEADLLGSTLARELTSVKRTCAMRKPNYLELRFENLRLLGPLKAAV